MNLHRSAALCAIIFLVSIPGFVWWRSDQYLVIGEVYMSSDGKPFSFNKIPRPATQSENSGKPFQYFRKIGRMSTFFLTAFAVNDRPIKGRLNININTFDGAHVTLKCCIILSNHTLLITNASEPYKMPRAGHFHATQYTCSLPLGTDVVQMSLTSSSCSHDVQDYIPVKRPVQRPGGLALCGKTLFGKDLRPQRLVEWIEIQKLLGVDKILIFDLDNPESIRKIFRYYSKQGILDVQPFELPGRIDGVAYRDLYKHRHRHDGQFFQDESFVLLDCRERLSGYSWVMGIDADEIILPRKNVTLKPFIKELTAKHPQAAGFHFYIMFHYTSHGKTRNHSSGMEHLEYSRSTPPQWKAYKYFYIPDRVVIPSTHRVNAKAPYTVPRVSPSDGVIHHVRPCHLNESVCFPPGSVIDDSLLRFEAELPQRVKQAMKEMV
ncbi:uncharacterized protein LOC124134422 [Haliotis rufescens]|uniref:uncharacterized protein LOC124134422 n=1 Tax=Haliotis rufescens TaxID=6454 RepID=UPI00201EC489|nr:uncharacterized protein LOC124134422 [Haliotis rufescens]XP_048237060.1 uncharacterized protein LOC124134422 [Haliotis rufescens]XP_048237061.1 uncharacterized protein LOC124134422 [Haliotis rufescens]